MTEDQDTSLQRDLFQTIQRGTTLSDRVTHQIEQLIIEGRLQRGDRLPPERELAQQFGVSRTVIREAVSALVAKSLLEVQPGSGTVVRGPTTKSVAQSMTLLLRAGQAETDYDKVHEVRRILEVEIAGLAAERRTSEDLKELEEILRQTAEAEIQDDHKSFPECDVAFHAALARATHNELFLLLLDSMADIMIKVRQLGFEVPDMPMRALKHHCAVFEQVRVGDAEGARRAMHEHLIESEDTMRQALALHLRQTQGESDQGEAS
jgi:GntR family transcriptional repressor for pyruvate dehydrogenase complex